MLFFLYITLVLIQIAFLLILGRSRHKPGLGYLFLLVFIGLVLEVGFLALSFKFLKWTNGFYIYGLILLPLAFLVLPSSRTKKVRLWALALVLILDLMTHAVYTSLVSQRGYTGVKLHSEYNNDKLKTDMESSEYHANTIFVQVPLKQYKDLFTPFKSILTEYKNRVPAYELAKKHEKLGEYLGKYPLCVEKVQVHSQPYSDLARVYTVSYSDKKCLFYEGASQKPEFRFHPVQTAQ